MNRADKIIEYGLYALVFLLPVQTRWIIRDTGLEYTTISLYGTDILLIALLSLFVFYKIKSQITSASQRTKSRISEFPNFRISNVWLFAGILELAAFLSIFFAPDRWLAVAGYLRLLLGIGLFWLVTAAAYDRMRLTWSFLAGVFLQAALAIWQFLSQSTFASKWLGIASHGAGALAGESVIETAGGRWLRAYGGLDHPNVLGGVLAVGIIILVAQGLREHRSREFLIFNFQFLNNFKFFNFIIFYLFLAVFSSALFFTFSRAAWLALLAGLFISALAVFARGDSSLIASSGLRRIKKIKMAKAVLTVALVFSSLLIIYGDLAQSRTGAIGRLESKSISERTLYYNDFKSLLKENRLFGAGIGNYAAAVQKENPGRPAYNYQPVHNVFFLIWSEIGIIGLIGFVGLFVNLIIGNYLKIKDLKLKIHILGTAGGFYLYNMVLTAILIILSVFDHWLWSLHAGVLLFWFAAAYVSPRSADDQ